MAFHDLTPGQIIPPQAKFALGLGMKFIRNPPVTTKDLTPALLRLKRDVQLRTFFAGQEDDDYSLRPSKLYIRSKWTPPPGDIPPVINDRLDSFSVQLRKLFRQKQSTPNLLPAQERTLRQLHNNHNLLFPDSDKGLGPCAVTYDQYVTDCLIHLTDTSTYSRLTKNEALSATNAIYDDINAWIKRHRRSLDPMDIKFINHHMQVNQANPFGQFYATYKIHKGKKDSRWPTRPVCSDVTSIQHGLGKWIDQMLQPIAKQQPTYFKDSFALKQSLQTLHLPPNALLFTSDAVSMYTNIQTEPALLVISNYLREHDNKTFRHYNATALIEALNIVFRNNIIKFGDTYWRQISGTGMGISPAPPWATIFFGTYESSTILPKWSHYVKFYRRFIDDVFGIWVSHPCPDRNNELWLEFQADMQGWHGLRWEFTNLSSTCTFMDLTLSITNNRIESSLHEKSQNLYLYIPPHSCHPKNMISGLICGNILRFHRLCSSLSDIKEKTSTFRQRLIDRGYNSDIIDPIIADAHKKAIAYLRKHNRSDHQTSPPPLNPPNQVFFHLQYHPQDPKPHEIQRIWNEQVAHPPHKVPLHKIQNLQHQEIPINKLTIAYSRPMNLRNQFSVRIIVGRGKDVSTYLPAD